MISQFNAANTRSVINSTINEPKEPKKAELKPNAQLGEQNRVEQLKSSIASGEYKVDLDALAQKMAQDLL